MERRADCAVFLSHVIRTTSALLLRSSERIKLGPCRVTAQTRRDTSQQNTVCADNKNEKSKREVRVNEREESVTLGSPFPYTSRAFSLRMLVTYFACFYGLSVYETCGLQTMNYNRSFVFSSGLIYIFRIFFFSNHTC